ncbi:MULTISPECIES: hypothetical protein [unclassified Paraburkholderia]|uniref:hypothetical protein n=1 Tax=unclassified Paraburkholderia TaxID=2615204 RepID=UPI00160B3370|nr:MULTISPECIES: hypothetical protein [unclassified Paraburkholderia]MBB5445429.1 hypothetical protein [Paraburkholderia sp. WSM4177]MBB5486091.1 hypothetical protein [Paraburkholderia sp. WSM4180]
MTIRLACASTFTAVGLACSSAAYARVVVYLPAAVVYAPPPRPVYYPVPVNPVYVSAPPVAVPVAAATIVAVPPVLNYAVVPAPTVSYAQPLVIAPR